MKKKSSIVKLSIAGFFIVVGLLFCFLSFPVWNNYTFTSFVGSIDLGLDLKGGYYAVYEADGEDVADFEVRMNDAKKRLSDMLSSRGYIGSNVILEGADRIRLEVVTDASDANIPTGMFDIIGQPCKIEFVINAGSDNEAVVLRGSDVKSAAAGYLASGNLGITLKLTDEGKTSFADYTERYTGSTMSVYKVVDGAREASPVGSETIEAAMTDGEAYIGMANSTSTDILNLTDQINSGTFDLDLTVIDSSTMRATLGENAALFLAIAGGVGMLLMLAFVIWRYRFMGVATAMSALAYLALILFFISVFPWAQLTVWGFMGMFIGLMLTVGAHVTVFERIRDEYRGGKSILASYYAGYKRALAPVIDVHAVMLIVSVILLFFAGAARSMGIPLMTGVILSILCVLVFSRFFLKWILACDSTDPKRYNLSRSASVKEIPDEVSNAELDAGQNGTGEPQQEGASV